MRSRADGAMGSTARAALLVSIVCFAGTLLAAEAGGPPPTAAIPATAGSMPTIGQVQQATDAVRADPNLGTERKSRTLRWRGEEKEQARGDTPAWLQWLVDLFGWIGQSARLLVWVLCGVLAALVVIYLLRLVRERGPRATLPAAAPTHVRDLDIRPESLPDDIGAAARQLWDAGDARRALALLYRGLLSRLAHVHHAPVRDSTTEGDTVALARGALPPSGHDYAALLVQTWLHAVYGGSMPDTPRVHALCEGFVAALDTVGAVSGSGAGTDNGNGPATLAVTS